MHPKDHFSACAAQYADFRPHYPQALYQWLAATAPARSRAWDCACGSGQASADLASYFDEVIATDLSAAQLRQAKPDPRISYRVAVAEDSGLPAAHFDLVSVAQALHWFDCERFYAEARRVLRPGGLLAVWSYGICSLDHEHGGAELLTFYRDVVGPYWPAERRHVASGYQTLSFPAPELTVPALAVTQLWSLAELTGYASSWSATAAYIKARGEDPVPALRTAMAPHWGDEQSRHEIRWPLAVRAALLDRP